MPKPSRSMPAMAGSWRRANEFSGGQEEDSTLPSPPQLQPALPDLPPLPDLPSSRPNESFTTTHGADLQSNAPLSVELSEDPVDPLPKDLFGDTTPRRVTRSKIKRHSLTKADSTSTLKEALEDDRYVWFIKYGVALLKAIESHRSDIWSYQHLTIADNRIAIACSNIAVALAKEDPQYEHLLEIAPISRNFMEEYLDTWKNASCFWYKNPLTTITGKEEDECHIPIAALVDDEEPEDDRPPPLPPMTKTKKTNTDKPTNKPADKPADKPPLLARPYG
ncbi:uncharacterized protein J7T54_001798 [Emericellopsis cladophorae]|uniref:Uncharacterized protein n=1 Tax=Emericellopsis cladophorae TaxID=2686198 RepID=A0A9Q0BFX8_9HYPO|nr:uncharacterized protein J7T54_001798 [Emericellopsis cladophorae]KAI6783922.1 hypothetical protein J7T54_001798 [Emericellopsis cladophorae]